MLFTREAGEGPPIVVLHGGPDFDQNYLLPELDRLGASHRLVYYDQRGRGRSARGVRAEDVTIDSEIDDLDGVLDAAGLERAAVLGHSWGGLLAAEYATRRPQRVSHLILLNTAPVSRNGMLALRAHLRSLRTADELATMDELAASDRFRAGDLEADAAYSRIHFRPAFHRAELLERVVGRLRSHFTPATLVLAREIEHRLYEQTWLRDDYDLRPQLADLDVPALVLHGTQDFIPVGVASDVADSIAGAVLRVLPECGHFSYLEQPEDVERHIAALLG